MQPIYTLRKGYFSNETEELKAAQALFEKVKYILGHGLEEVPVHLRVKEKNQEKMPPNHGQIFFEFCLSNQWVKDHSDQFKVYSSRKSRGFEGFIRETGLGFYVKDPKLPAYPAPDQILSLRKVPWEALESLVIPHGKERIKWQALLKGINVIEAETDYGSLFGGRSWSSY